MPDTTYTIRYVVDDTRAVRGLASIDAALKKTQAEAIRTAGILKVLGRDMPGVKLSVAELRKLVKLMNENDLVELEIQEQGATVRLKKAPSGASLATLAQQLLPPGPGSAAPAAAAASCRVNTFTTYDQLNPATAMDAAGDFVIVWQSSQQEDPTSNAYGVFAQRYGDHLRVQPVQRDVRRQDIRHRCRRFDRVDLDVGAHGRDEQRGSAHGAPQSRGRPERRAGAARLARCVDRGRPADAADRPEGAHGTLEQRGHDGRPQRRVQRPHRAAGQPAMGAAAV